MIKNIQEYVATKVIEYLDQRDEEIAKLRMKVNEFVCSACQRGTPYKITCICEKQMICLDCYYSELYCLNCREICKSNPKCKNNKLRLCYKCKKIACPCSELICRWCEKHCCNGDINNEYCDICKQSDRVKQEIFCSTTCKSEFMESYENHIVCCKCNIVFCACSCKWLHSNDKANCECEYCINNWNEMLCKKCNTNENVLEK